MKSSVVRDVASVGDLAQENPAVNRQDFSLIGHVQVSLAAQLGTVSLSIQDLFGLKSGDVVDMNELLDSPVTLMLNDRAVARGELLAVGDHFGIRILELA